jgi:hypothetical protein
MDINQFIKQRPYLYHLTSETNAKSIIARKKLFSANHLIELSKSEADHVVKRQKRHQHYKLTIEGEEYLLRDQRPISEKALSKCLTDGWSVGDFLFHLNNRVFMWPTLDRLLKHFNRYEQEQPVIFRFSTESILHANPHVKFSRLNSGATRANSHLGGKAPERGPNTFLSADHFPFSVRAVAEVTFEDFCTIAGDFGWSTYPTSVYKPL